MAFCTYCGSTMDPNSHFCTKCGKQVSAAVTGTAATPAASPVTPPQSYTPPAAAQTYNPQAQPKSGGGAMKIVLIVLGVLVAIGRLGIIGTVGPLVFGASNEPIKRQIRRSRNRSKPEAGISSPTQGSAPRRPGKFPDFIFSG